MSAPARRAGYIFRRPWGDLYVAGSVGPPTWWAPSLTVSRIPGRQVWVVAGWLRCSFCVAVMVK